MRTIPWSVFERKRYMRCCFIGGCCALFVGFCVLCWFGGAWCLWNCLRVLGVFPMLGVGVTTLVSTKSWNQSKCKTFLSIRGLSEEKESLLFNMLQLTHLICAMIKNYWFTDAALLRALPRPVLSWHSSYEHDFHLATNPQCPAPRSDS